MRFARIIIWILLVVLLAFIARPLGFAGLVVGVLWLVAVEPRLQRRSQRRMWSERFPHEHQR